jgi:hypothetical protein
MSAAACMNVSQRLALLYMHTCKQALDGHVNPTAGYVLSSGWSRVCRSVGDIDRHGCARTRRSDQREAVGGLP